MPLFISATEVKISKSEIKGEKLCFYAIYPNPLNSNKYIAIIGYNNPGFISLGAERDKFEDVSDYGWYDYKVWDDNNLLNSKTAGFFNNHWE